MMWVRLWPCTTAQALLRATWLSMWLLPVFVPAGAGKADRAVLIGSLSSSPQRTTRAAVSCGFEQITCAAGVSADGVVSSYGSLFAHRSSPSKMRRQAHRDLIPTDSLSVSMVKRSLGRSDLLTSRWSSSKVRSGRAVLVSSR